MVYCLLFIVCDSNYAINSSAFFFAFRSCLRSVRSVEAAIRIFTNLFFFGSQSRFVMILGMNLRFVALLEKERLFPAEGCFPVI